MTNEKPTETSWADPDDAEPLTRMLAESADLYRGETLVRRGRPRLATIKLQVALRLDPDVIDRFKADGAEWQSRMNEALRKAAGL